MENGRLLSIWIKRMRLGPMDAAESASAVAGRGLVGNANQGGKRQVTILEEEVWEALMDGFNVRLSPATRRANLLVRGIRLANSRGRVLRVGDCRILIYGETRPCERMDEALQGLRRALSDNWGGGAFGEILNDAQIAIHDPVCWEDAEALK